MSTQEETPRFKKATIHEIFKQTWTNDRLSSLSNANEPIPKINDVALHLSVEYLRLFTIELIHRSNKLAEEHDDEEKNDHNEKNEIKGVNNNDFNSNCLIEVKHLQQVAPGALLDF
ncbi:hypothetical protein CROQUDRAFT_658614 [Cronartium quercuum f. sp. fusiforme G11]|uniref:Uncharacterized protein n=1 Tax=Cronartium quercuum f. sp. fusiforme G11 TaxID=708437 RepID=A0A9P6NJQ8_9BASI|nr:hypothetical protein CROQUDRAFT_658614 [Cronartium quercuum f. sp. fusiforme G11]